MSRRKAPASPSPAAAIIDAPAAPEPAIAALPAPPALPDETFLPDPDADEPFGRVSRRADGWSAANQRRFLEAIGEGHGVEAACRRVGLSVASAYAFRRTPKGAAFALGWRAASLVAREAIAETLLVRALEGQVDTYVRADGTHVTRHRHDNRLAMSLLARLDRQVEAAPDADVKAARLVAQEFHAYLDLVGRDEGPARAGLFLARRCGGLIGDDGNEAGDTADLAPIYALATADRLARTGIATAGEVPVDDLDPARRGEWTAEQWARAEAAGLLRLAIPSDPAADTDPLAGENAPAPQLPQHSRETDLLDGDGDGPIEPETLLWWDEDQQEWLTRFPPPDDFDGDEEHTPDHPDYCRTLTPAEEAAIGPPPEYLDDTTLDLLADRREGFFAGAAMRLAERQRRWAEASDSLFPGDAPI